MKLILHAGTHKTGTTTIQAALARNRGWLRRRGILYPNLHDGRTNHNLFAHRVAREDPEELRRALLQDARADTTIVSAEEFWALTSGREDWLDLGRDDYWERRRNYLTRLRAVLADFDAVAVHICLRRQDEFASSLYATKLLGGKFDGSFEDFLRGVMPIFDYRKQVDLFEEFFPDVRTMRFDALRANLVPKFCAWVGIPQLPGRSGFKKVTPDARLIWWLGQRAGANPEPRAPRAQFARSRRAENLFADAPKATLWSSETSRRSFLDACGVTEIEADPGSHETRIPAEEDERVLRTIDAAFENWRSAGQSLGSRIVPRLRSVFSRG